MREARFPERNELGLVLPPSQQLPSTVSEEPLSIVNASPEFSRLDIHHMYWPGEFWKNLGAPYRKFQTHPLNQVRMVRGRHFIEHWLYDDSVLAMPEELVPQRLVVQDFLEEAEYFDMFRRYVSGYRNMPNGLRKGLYKSRGHYHEMREERIRNIGVMAARLISEPTEVIPHSMICSDVAHILRTARLEPPANLVAA